MFGRFAGSLWSIHSRRSRRCLEYLCDIEEKIHSRRKKEKEKKRKRKEKKKKKKEKGAHGSSDGSTIRPLCTAIAILLPGSESTCSKGPSPYAIAYIKQPKDWQKRSCGEQKKKKRKEKKVTHPNIHLVIDHTLALHIKELGGAIRHGTSLRRQVLECHCLRTSRDIYDRVCHRAKIHENRGMITLQKNIGGFDVLKEGRATKRESVQSRSFCVV